MSEFSFDCCHLIYLITAACSDNFFYFGVVHSVFLPTSNICIYAFICDINQLFNNLMVGFVGICCCSVFDDQLFGTQCYLPDCSLAAQHLDSRQRKLTNA